MSVVTRIIELDETGAGKIGTPPEFYVGSPDPGTAHNMGRDLPAGLLTLDEYEIVSGEVTVSGGTPNGTFRAFFWQSA